MKKIAIRLSVISFTMLIISGCSFGNDSLFPAENKTTGSQTNNMQASYNANVNMPNLGTTNFEPIQISSGQSTGTFVGQKVIAFRNELINLQDAIRKHNNELQKIRASINVNAVQHQEAVNSVESRLQIGTTPGNPHVISSLQSAQNNIRVMNDNAISTNQLSTRVVSDVAMISYVLNSIKTAYTISGAVDEDHQQLKVLQNEAERTSVVLNNILNEVNNDYARQQQYIATANKTISSLEEPVRRGNLSGYPRSEPVNIAHVSPNPVVPVNTYAMTSSPVQQENFSSRPLLAIKFNKDNVSYKDGLVRAVAGALKAKPTIMFDIVAVTPPSSTPAMRNNARTKATEVFQEIISAGVSPDRVSLSAKSSVDAASTEVHVYVK